MAAGRDLKGGNNNVIAVIGDGAMSAGMAYEAMNNAGHLGSRLIVILNDNDMSIAPPVRRHVRLSGQARFRPDLPDPARCGQEPGEEPAETGVRKGGPG